jgi:hypothetical protein
MVGDLSVKKKILTIDLSAQRSPEKRFNVVTCVRQSLKKRKCFLHCKIQHSWLFSCNQLRATDRFFFLRANESPFYQFVLVLYNYCQRRKGFVYVYNKKPTFITVNYTCDVFVSMKLQKHFWRFLKKHIRNSRSVKNLTAGGRYSAFGETVGFGSFPTR